MRMKSISLSTAFALASTAALAQGGAVGRNTQGGPASATGQDMNNAATGDAAMQNNTTIGSSKPSPKDASTQGAGTAGAVDKRGDATSPGGTMRKQL
ncbi:MAG: hypothetical protein ABW175_13365 [Bradyrhizobium sp.]